MATAFPVFLLGALSVQLRQSLHFGASVLGLIAALYYVGAGVPSVSLGRKAEALGGLRTMRLASAGSSVMLLLLATVTRSWVVLGVLMVPAGVCSAAMGPATNIFLSRRIPTPRQGLAFGIKQAAVPLTSALGGLAVPAIALTVGWRWAFVTAAVWSAATAVLIPRPQESLAARRARMRNDAGVPFRRAPLIVLTVGFGIGVGGASSLAAFLVSSAVVGGIDRVQAGLLVALGGGIAAGSRVLSGLLADRRGSGHLRAAATMLAFGALGYGALGLASHDRLAVVYLVAVVAAFGGGWGWNGLVNLAIVHAHPHHPGHATGILQTGGRAGGMLGPFIFGEIVSHSSYSVAWLMNAGAALCAAAVIVIGRRMLMSSATAASDHAGQRGSERSAQSS